MTPFARLARNLAQRIANSYYEGPEPPERLSLLALDFANMNPRATRAEWLAFAQRLAGESYRSGYVRGYEATARDDDQLPRLPPELVADSLDPDWRWRPAFGPELECPGDLVEDVVEAPEVDVERATGRVVRKDWSARSNAKRR